MKGLIIKTTLIIIAIVSIFSFSVAGSGIVDSMDFAGEEKAISLEQAVQTALKDNISVSKALLECEQAKVQLEKSNSMLNDAKKIYESFPKQSSTYLENITLPELTADFQYQNAKRSYDTVINSVKAEIEKLYFDVQSLNDLVAIGNENLDRVKDTYEKAKKKYELGLVSKTDVLSAELALLKAQTELKATRNSLIQARMLLNTKLGIDIMNNTKLTDKLEYKEKSIIGIGKAVESALNNRHEIKALQFDVDLNKLNMDIYKTAYSEVYYSYRDYKIKYEKALKELEAMKKNIELSVRNNYLNVTQKQSEIITSQKSVTLSEEVLKITQALYDKGMTTIDEVQKAQANLKQAKVSLSKAVLDYNLAVSEFEDSIGVGRAASGM